MVVMLCIAHCLSVDGNSLCKGKGFPPRKTAGWRILYCPGWPIKLFQQDSHCATGFGMRKFPACHRLAVYS